jgi:hypothetical protein
MFRIETKFKGHFLFSKIKIMKNLFFTLAFMLIGSFAFASNVKIDCKSETIEKKQTTCIEITNPCDTCANGCCRIEWIDGNGILRSYWACCGSLIAISQAPNIPAKHVSKN